MSLLATAPLIAEETFSAAMRSSASRLPETLRGLLVDERGDKGGGGGVLGVYGYENCSDAEVTGFVKESRCFGAVDVDVDLEEEGLVGCARFYYTC